MGVSFNHGWQMMSDINQPDVESIRDSIDARDRYELLRQARMDTKRSHGG